MKEPNEDELKNIFDDKSLNKSLKKAKRVTFFRTLFISAIVSILLVVGIYKTNLWWMSEKGSEVASELIRRDAVMKAPNTIINTETLDIGLFKGTIKREVYKVIEDKVIPWDTQEVHFGLRGFQSTSFSSHSTNIDDTTQIHIPSGEREMLFYVPQFNYKNYANDLSKIKEFPNDKYIEMAISFDKSYSLEEVKTMLPKSVNPTWYWVNYYSNKSDDRESPESGQWLFGISDPSSKLGQVLSTPKVKSESDFLDRLKKFNKNDYEYVKKRQKDGLIIGVVVTGTKDSLSSLQGQPYVKASSLGVIVDKY
ncbi:MULTISPECIES: anti sigma factor C-terminal domain-containing protein [Bacillus]|uniref:anti sigma factor C-terminal domain-containing protein n=1 Tax=Bacillus TaxID=1386 RepID=UPI002243D638|nr:MULTISPECIES: anti sigma factor C-terminal domain-containing protein [Bacillus]MDN5387026.1 anti sigma factor C-terminal domain-containing protein [Bacillus sp. LB7]MEC1020937.1 anti sigma factor C-terminal domain-containing protein [Bacillus paralicheniformis]MEC1028415.1 anti sigma factor C-terminal domain-containing protein [Bacillus paralicheniformis]MEC1033471.1 anti sigma factor C-terminal domain-containing protein [Bacillus paralicheniformis]MEC1051197.1 anti sigma factor C-terminal 